MRDRRDIINLHGDCIKARQALEVDLAAAKTIFHPKTMARNWTARQKAILGQVAGNAADVAKKNSLLIAATAIGALLFMARKPISRLTHKLWHERKTEQDLT